MPTGTIRFDLGGRLYGGWWQNLSKDRRAFIRIVGEPVAVLDFKSMFARLAYVHAGESAPPGDLYALPGFEDYREGVKQVFSAMLSRRGPLKRIPKDCSELPSGCTGKIIRAAILDRHPGLQQVFETGVGYELMFLESQILIAILRRLIDLGIVALPLHDGLMVAESKADRAAQVMGDVAKELTGHRLAVDQKAVRTASEPTLHDLRGTSQRD